CLGARFDALVCTRADLPLPRGRSPGVWVFWPGARPDQRGRPPSFPTPLSQGRNVRSDRVIPTHVPHPRRRERRRATMRRGLAAAAVSAVLVTTAGLPAVAVDNYPDEPAEAAASVLASQLLQQELVGAATSDAGSVSNPGPNTENLDVDLLGSQLLQLGDIEIPVDQLLDFGQIGVLASTSEASGPADAHAVSGAVGADGGVTLDGAEDDFGTASIDVLSLARLAGVDGLTDAVVDELTLELGALAAEVTAEDGVILDPDGGVTGPGQYRLGDGTMLVH